MRSENRSQIDQKYAKKIEAIVRKAPNGIKDAEDSYQNETKPCPICDCNLQIMELSCHQCKTHLPMCIATVITIEFHFSKEIHNETFQFDLLGSTHCAGRCGGLSCLRFFVL